MAIKLHTTDWQIAKPATTRAATRSGTPILPGLPPEFLTTQSSVDDEFVAQPAAQVRGASAAPTALDFSYDLAPGQAAVLAIRHPSGALTFHAPVETNRPTRGGSAEVRFIVPVPKPEPGAANRGIVTQAIKAIVIKVGGQALDAVAGFALGKLAIAFETATWKRKGLKEGWLKVDQKSLSEGTLIAERPKSTERSLLLIHGTFSNAASAYASLAASDFFAQVAPLYGDRIFAFDHFSISRTPEENARMLLEQLPDKTFTFDVITHSRGGLVLRNLVERQAALGPLASRFALGRAVLVAAPNEGTPLATPRRWEETVGWIANLLELFPENPFTTGADFVANGLVWIARHASGDLPGIHAMDADGDPIVELQGPPGPPADRYSALVANYNPTASVLKRLADVGVDQFFNTANDLVVPSEGGWRVDPATGTSIPGARIGCFGPGGNIPGDSVTHVNFFSQPDSVTFIVKALAGQSQSIAPIDPSKSLPDRRLIRAGASVASAPIVSAIPAPAVSSRAAAAPAAALPRAAASMSEPLDIAVVNGDLSFEQLPLMVGHYRSSLLTGTEKVLNSLLNEAMRHALELGVYPNEPTSNRIFINTTVAKSKAFVTPRPKAVIVAGLGREGKLQSMEVVRTVRQAVIAWAESHAEQNGKPEPLALASTLMGSGGANITAGQAAQLIAQGVHEANELLDQHSKGDSLRLPRVRQLRFVELYLERASEAWRALKMLAEANPGRFRVAEPVITGTGWLRRPLDSGYRGADYDFISAETRRDGKATSIAYSLDTKRARTEVRAQATQSRLLRNLVASASNDQEKDDQLGKTLFRLLIPLELEGYLSGSTDTQIELDEGTAGIPWELLDDSDPKEPVQEPWAIRAKLLRKFKTEKFRPQVTDADVAASILVVGEPECPPEYPPLPGARQEARDVYATLTSDVGVDAKQVRRLFTEQATQVGPDARTVVNALFERDWRIIHIAGHGEPTGPDGGPGGVVLSNNTFLGPNEINALRVVPELVFINCCYIGGVGTNSVLRNGGTRLGIYDRTVFASGVAEALINIGVRCVVAAGWAVDDLAAGAFAKTFYRALLRGERFIEAVAQARREAKKGEGNTWAAYQCYGDPDWVFRRDKTATRSARRANAQEFNDVGSVEGVRLALETLVAQSTYQGYDAAYQLERARHLEARFKRMGWKASGDIAELFAKAFAAAGDFATAIQWYESAIDSSDGDVSFRAVEQASNLRVRQAWRAVEALRHSSPSAPARTQQAQKRRLQTALAAARTVINRETKVLARLSGFNDTAERESLFGGAMKRLAMIEAEARRPAAEARAFEEMKRHYQRALEISERDEVTNLFYPAMQLMVADLALNASRRKKSRLDATLVAAARKSIAAKNQSDPDFWSFAAQTELLLYEALAGNALPKQGPTIERGYNDLYKRSQGSSNWGSVYDNANFVLSKYLSQMPPKTKKVATRILEALRKRATSDPAGQPEPSVRKTRSKAKRARPK